MYKPSLGTRNHILTKKYSNFRRKKFELQDLDLLLDATHSDFTIATADTLLRYTDYTKLSVQHTSQANRVKILLQVDTITFEFAESHKFELWIIRRILRAKIESKYAPLLPKLHALYSLFKSIRLGHKF